MAASPIICFLRAADSTNAVLSGAKANIYAAGTTTPLSLFSDTALSVAAANPIVADAFGQFAIRYFAPVAYKIATTTSADVAVTGLSWDNIDPGVPITTGALPVANGGTGATTAGGARTNLGAAADSTVTSLASDVTTLQSYHTGTAALKVATGTTAQRSGSPAAYDMRGNSTLTSPEMYLGGTWHKISLAPPGLGFRNLVVTNNSGTPDTHVDIDADSVILRDTNNVSICVNSVNLTIDCTTTGANALDASSLANSTWYFLFVIFNPTTGTTAGLASTSATSPTLPSGYTFFSRVGSIPTNGSAVFHRILQKGRRTQYVVAAATTTVVPNITNGIQSSTYSATSPTLVAKTVVGNGFVAPSTAVAINVIALNLYAAGTGGSVLVAPNTTYGGTNRGPSGSAGNAYPLWSSYSSNVPEQPSAWIMLETTTIAYAADNTGSAISCLGWEDNL